MDNDVAIFLDLDNVVIGATEASLTFDVDLVLEHIRSLTQGRIVLRRAYGDWRQRANMTKDLATAGFELQSTVRLNSNSKNLADMQMVVDAMGTLVDGHDFRTYVLITGDRDFAPLVQALRKRGKQVIGVGVRHATSQSLASLCDAYVFYDELTATARRMLDDEIEELIQRALDQLLQEEERVPASLLKQRMQALSKGSFGRSPQGKRNFRKLLGEHPGIVALQQEGTTLYVCRPGAAWLESSDAAKNSAKLADEKVEALIQQSLDELLVDRHRVRASLLKQRMQDLSDGVFDETEQGDRSFRKFLDRYPYLVRITQDGSTLYVGWAHGAEGAPNGAGQGVSALEAAALLRQALDELLVEQPRVRASLLKQRMQELSHGAFDETAYGDETFRHFLDRHPNLVQIQQKGTTLLAFRPEDEVDQAELHLIYRSALKKRGLRVVPSDMRLLILKDLVATLERQTLLAWREAVNDLFAAYQQTGQLEMSKSYINDVLRAARRAEVIHVAEGGSLATAPIDLQVKGPRAFQEAVIRCDAMYLTEIQALEDPFVLEEAALALYETVGHARYLKVVLTRFSENGQFGG
ncbi:MAG: NYN domain-containing protein [Candidatus Promineifilaceae bacterium]